MNSRVSQLELSGTEDSFSSGCESSPSPVQSPVTTVDRDSPLPSEQDFDQSASTRIPFFLIGLLLSATAIAKLWMLLTDSFADIRVGLPKEVLWLSVVFELWLAFENFRVRDHRVLSLVNTVVFGFFAIFASVRWLLGYSSCGCSGNLELPAWLFILIDIGIVVWFSTTEFQRSKLHAGFQSLCSSFQSWSPEKRGRLAGLIIFGGVIIGMQMPIAAPLRALVVGEPPIIAITKIDGELFLNQETTGTVEIQNRSPHLVKIVGISRSCSCFDLSEDQLSRLIPANGQIQLPLVLKPSKPGPLHQRVELFLDHPKQFRVNVDVISFVLGE